MEEIQMLKDWLSVEQKRASELAQAGHLIFEERLDHYNRAIAMADVIIKLQEFEELCHNKAIDAIIEQGRLSESILHHASQDGITSTNDMQANYGEEKMLEQLSENKLNQPNK